MSFLVNPFRFGGGAGGSGGPPQPSLANVIYLPDHLGAADESTSITDDATGGTGNPHSFTYNDNAKNDNADTAYGNGTSIQFDGTGDTLTRAFHADFRTDSANPLDTAEFCFEMYIKRAATGVEHDFYTRYNSTSNLRVFIFGTTTGDKVRFIGSNNGTSATSFCNLAGTTSIGTTSWHHVAVSRQNGFSATEGQEDIVRLFVDGFVEDSVQVDDLDGFLAEATIGPRFGARQSGGGDMNGRIDGIRLTIGEPVYTENFTPPTVRHPTS